MKRKTPSAAPGSPKKATATSSGMDDQLFTTTVRLGLGQWDELRKEALRRSLEGGADRRPDASRILRELIDEWLAKRGR